MRDIARPDQLQAIAGERFEVLRELGRGGMATVHLANDRALGRPVAIKVLHPVLATVVGADRFEHEIRTTARLVHPNIVPLFEAGSAAGLLYYVMPFIEGETLRDHLERGPLELDQAISIARDVTEALAYAHSQGLVHRDIKPENVFCYQGRALLADFGIAKAMDLVGSTSLTATGLVLGTPTYMSPEQATGADEVDARADLYSLGCLLFEMLTGRPPFHGANVMAVISRHLTEPPPALPATLPSGLRRLVDELLRKEPADRPGSSVEVLDRLRLAKTPAAPAAHVDQGAMVAVLPFINGSPDAENEYFADGLTEELISALGGVRGIRVVPHATVIAFKGRVLELSHQAAALKARSLVHGTVRKSGDRVRITVELVDSEGVRQWADRYDRKLEDIFAVQDDITARILEALKAHLGASPVAGKTKRFTDNAEAWDLYLQGHAYWMRAVQGGPGSRDLVELAKSYYSQALALEPNYVPAIQGLADSHHLGRVRGLKGYEDGARKGRELMQRAVAAGGEWAQTHVTRAVDLLYFGDDFESAAAEIRRAVEIDPNHIEGQRFHGVVLKILGRDNEALATLREAARLAPTVPFVQNGLGDQLLTMRRYEEAAEVLRTAIRMAGRYDAATERLELACYRSGRMDEAFEARRAWLTHQGKTARAASLAEGCARDGYPEARKRDITTGLTELLETAKTQDPFLDMDGSRCLGDRILLAYAELGEWSAVMDWVERGYQRRPGRLRRVLTDLPFDRRGLNGDPRYVRLLRTAGLEGLLTLG